MTPQPHTAITPITQWPGVLPVRTLVCGSVVYVLHIRHTISMDAAGSAMPSHASMVCFCLSHFTRAPMAVPGEKGNVKEWTGCYPLQFFSVAWNEVLSGTLHMPRCSMLSRQSASRATYSQAYIKDQTNDNTSQILQMNFQLGQWSKSLQLWPQQSNFLQVVLSDV